MTDDARLQEQIGYCRAPDVAFFSFSLSHVPSERFEAFCDLASALAPAGRAFFIDSLYDHESTDANHAAEGLQAQEITRLLDDGRTFRIVKVFHEPAELQDRLQALSWDAQVASTGRHFLHGRATPPGSGTRG